jgi:hypothetical protein
MVAILSACALSAQQPGGSTPTSAQRPIQVTVVAPDKTPAEKLDERQRAERQDTTNSRIATFTLLLVLVGIGQIVATAFGYVAAKRAAQAAEDAIILNNRPKIIVREIDVPETTHWRKVHLAEDRTRAIAEDAYRHLDETGVITNERTLKGSFRMTNKGGTEVSTQLIETMFWVGEPLPQTNPVFDTVGLPQQHFKMKGGTTTRVDIPPVTISLDQHTDIMNGRASLWVLGKIVYTDKVNAARRTGFARRFNLDTGRFERKKDEDYDYED